ncbi:MAG: Resolvase protein [Firmicutes bacterium]|nr:Resolvase protein [Bacillota bacterium]
MRIVGKFQWRCSIDTQKMSKLAREQKMDLIITKSISRFARNTTVVLEIARELKSLGVEILFEKENISTVNGDGELMLTVLSSFAQEASKSTSENLKWRYKRKFEQGEIVLNATRFLGYDKDDHGNLVINPSQAEIVRRIFHEYIGGKGSFVIAKELNAERVRTVAGGRWHSSTVLNILKNEKYKGDALLQKTYTVDFLSKKRADNTGQVPQYYVEDSHPAIIDKEMWEAVQLEMERRRNFALKYGIQKLEHATSSNLLQEESSAVFAARFLAGRYGTLLMKGLEELSGDATASTRRKGKRDVKASILMMRFCIRLL